MTSHAAYLALVVHDLKNALGALEGRLEALQHTAEPDPDIWRDGVHGAWQQCMQMRRQLIAFLTLYGTDGDLAPHVADESPAGLLARLARDAGSTGVSAAVQVTLGTSVPPFWYYDARLVRLAMEAALHNAARFARREIRLGADFVDGYLVFTVDDDGPGLGAPDESGCAAGSTGLGTRLCRAVAQSHRSADRTGQITLENRPQGGAHFALWLP